jgi:hypothetical protein
MTYFEANTPRIVWDRANGEVVALDCVAGIYYRLNPAASEVWQLLDEGVSVDQLREAGVDSGDLAALIEELSAADILRARTNPHSDADPVEITWSGGQLHIERFDDLQEILEADPIHEVEPTKGWSLGG